jgi:hypothetical protein
MLSRHRKVAFSMEHRTAPAVPVKRCANCHRLTPQRDMVWDLQSDWWICERHLPPRFNGLCDWGEIDALCLRLSVLLDRNDWDPFVRSPRQARS